MSFSYCLRYSLGKRDVKVKALEAAEAAKRLEEKRQNDRAMRKAAAKLERERLEQENAKLMELQQKQKEETRKKKEAEIAARKRQREDEARKEKEKKRRCMQETKKPQRLGGERLHAGKDGKKLRQKAAVSSLLHPFNMLNPITLFYLREKHFFFMVNAG